MLGKSDLRKFIFFCLSFIGLFALTRFSIIDPGLHSIPIRSSKPLVLNYGEVGIIKGENSVELFWGSVTNENFQDIYHRLNYLFDNKAEIKSVQIHLHEGLFAQRVFDGNGLDRIIPYYPLVELIDRAASTGLSYEFILTFSKYILGIPFRSSREVNLLYKNNVLKKSTLPYFWQRVVDYKKTHINYLNNTYYLWLISEMLTNNGTEFILNGERGLSKRLPDEIKFSELIEKLRKIHKNKIKFQLN